ncbi:MAG: hypothetical protein GY751_09680 [Bacteroidetes bacterium]|nr:hypothetical protein [Bacteroidota bacterium]
MIDEQNFVASPRAAVKYALISSGIYVALTMVLFTMKTVVPDIQNFLMVLGAFIIGIVPTQFHLLRSDGELPGYERVWRYGNISGFIIAFIITLYHTVVLVQTSGGKGILIFFGFSLMSKCLLSLVISAIVAFFITRT